VGKEGGGGGGEGRRGRGWGRKEGEGWEGSSGRGKCMLGLLHSLIYFCTFSLLQSLFTGYKGWVVGLKVNHSFSC